MDKIKDKLQKTKNYFNKAMQCGNDLIFNNNCKIIEQETAL